MRNIYELKQEINDLKSVREVINTLERISAAFIPALRNHLNILQDYVNAGDNIYRNLRHKEDAKTNQDGQKLLIVFSTDRGLVGGLNSKITDSVISFFRENEDCRLAVFGDKARDLLRAFHRQPDLFFPALSDRPDVLELNSFFEQVFEGDLVFSEISVCAPRFVSVLEQRPEISKVWPVENNEEKEAGAVEAGFIYSFIDPSKKSVAKALNQKLLKLSIYEKALNAKLCEHAARMTAMSDAGRSAGKIIGSLERLYFKSRQQMITKRLLEVFSAKQSLRQE